MRVNARVGELTGSYRDNWRDLVKMRPELLERLLVAMGGPKPRRDQEPLAQLKGFVFAPFGQDLVSWRRRAAPKRRA